VFGDVCDGKMMLNEYGKIVQNEWYKTREMRKKIDLDEIYCDAKPYSWNNKYRRGTLQCAPTIIFRQ